MPIVMTAACRPYWGYRVHDLAAGDVIPDGEFADFLRATGAPVDEHTDGPAVDTDGDGVPEGNVEQVLTWVGDDRERAVAAFNAEADRGDKARKTLLAELEKRAQVDSDQAQ